VLVGVGEEAADGGDQARPVGAGKQQARSVRLAGDAGMMAVEAMSRTRPILSPRRAASNFQPAGREFDAARIDRRIGCSQCESPLLLTD
jgi:hypothetical protein